MRKFKAQPDSPAHTVGGACQPPPITRRTLHGTSWICSTCRALWFVNSYMKWTYLTGSRQLADREGNPYPKEATQSDPACWNCAHAKLDHEHDGCVVGVEGDRCGCERYNRAEWRQEIKISAHDVDELNEVARIVTNGSERHPLFSVRYGVACAILESQWLHDRLAAACESVHPLPLDLSLSPEEQDELEKYRRKQRRWWLNWW